MTSTRPDEAPLGRVLVIGARGIPDVEGGAEKNAEQLFPRLAALGYDVTLMGLSTYVKPGIYKGVKLIPAPTSWLLKTDKLFYYIAAVWHALRARPQIVHLQGLGAAIMLWCYKLLGFRVVVRYGSADYTLAKWGFIGRLGFLAAEAQLRFADAVISVADTLTRNLEKRGIRAKVHGIPNALDAPDPQWAPLVGPQHKPYVLALGRVTFQKNFDTLLRAFAVLAETNPDAELLIAGSLTDKPYVDTLGPLLSGRAKLLGAVPRSDVPQLLSRCSLYVNLSHHEGNSNATLEAISHGCPILVSDIPENRDMGLRSNNYVDRQDVTAIAATMATALANPQDFVVDRAGFLSWDDVARRTADVYRSILSTAG